MQPVCTSRRVRFRSSSGKSGKPRAASANPIRDPIRLGIPIFASGNANEHVVVVSRSLGINLFHVEDRCGNSLEIPMSMEEAKERGKANDEKRDSIADRHFHGSPELEKTRAAPPRGSLHLVSVA
jgi:hypothetical protein